MGLSNFICGMGKERGEDGNANVPSFVGERDPYVARVKAIACRWSEKEKVQREGRSQDRTFWNER